LLAEPVRMIASNMDHYKWSILEIQAVRGSACTIHAPRIRRKNGGTGNAALTIEEDPG
jgi:hypothetical protein